MDEWGVFVYFIVNALLRRNGIWNLGHTPLIVIIKTAFGHKLTATTSNVIELFFAKSRTLHNS